MEKFDTLIKFLSEGQNYAKAMEKACQIYDLKNFKIKKLTPTQVVKLYENLKNK